MLKTNIGSIDRLFRIAAGVTLLVWFFVDQSTGIAHYAKLIGIVPLLTGVMSSCPLYSILGLNTCPLRK